MSETIIPPYEKWGHIALTHAIASLIADVEEGKNQPHAGRMLDQAILVLNRRAAAAIERSWVGP